MTITERKRALERIKEHETEAKYHLDLADAERRRLAADGGHQVGDVLTFDPLNMATRTRRITTPSDARGCDLSDAGRGQATCRTMASEAASAHRRRQDERARERATI